MINDTELQTFKTSLSTSLHPINATEANAAYEPILKAIPRSLKAASRVDLSAAEWISQLKKWLICQFLMFTLCFITQLKLLHN